MFPYTRNGFFSAEALLAGKIHRGHHDIRWSDQSPRPDSPARKGVPKSTAEYLVVHFCHVFCTANPRRCRQDRRIQEVAVELSVMWRSNFLRIRQPTLPTHSVTFHYVQSVTFRNEKAFFLFSHMSTGRTSYTNVAVCPAFVFLSMCVPTLCPPLSRVNKTIVRYNPNVCMYVCCMYLCCALIELNSYEIFPVVWF